MNAAVSENTKSGIVDFKQRIKLIKEKFSEAMDDDFNVPEAMGFISGFTSYLYQNIENLSSDQIKQTFDFFKELNEFLGVFPEREYHPSIPSEVSELAEKREKYRKEEKWDEADKIRAQIEEMGYKVDDTTYGPLVVKK